jgi:hypothetical protein
VQILIAKAWRADAEIPASILALIVMILSSVKAICLRQPITENCFFCRPLMFLFDNLVYLIVNS